MIFSAAFKREALSCFAATFSAARSFPPRKAVPIIGVLAEEILAACFLLPCCEAGLRAQAMETIYATDASSSRAGACWCEVSEARREKLFRLAEDKGEYVRLDWSRLPEEFVPPAELTDA